MSRTIAIVEDEPAIRANYVDALQRYGWNVAAFASRPDAQIAFALKLPDLVIIDVGLGDEPEGGFELCRELRSRAPTLPIRSQAIREWAAVYAIRRSAAGPWGNSRTHSPMGSLCRSRRAPIWSCSSISIRVESRRPSVRESNLGSP